LRVLASVPIVALVAAATYYGHAKSFAAGFIFLFPVMFIAFRWGILEGRCSAQSSAGRGAVAMALCFDLSARQGLGLCQSGNGETLPSGESAKDADQTRCEGRQVRRGLGWHTFSHTYRFWLDETGAPMKVQQERMRHASIQTTMNVYGHVMAETKRRANSRVVGLVFGPNLQESAVSTATATVQ
ncbi:MAG TPA: hypothetical protein VHX63_09190, partial [Acidobacteriaceae bacterium]|nr:hypothetical protein [Acidobacteriaceae bacterium]